MTHLPLSGLRILSIEQYGAGPYGTMLLADLGAEVIKIEDAGRGGDVSRSVGPYMLGEADSEFFQTFSLGKKSVTLDLKSDEGRSQFESLVKSADAVANNLRGDQPGKLALTFDDLKAVNPKIVCAHLSAFGRKSERARWPGYDYLMQAEAGFMSMTGEPEGPPIRFGLSMVDFHTGSHMALGIVSAVLGAQRTGLGCDVDVCLFDTALHQLSYPATWYLNQGHITGRLPRGSHPSITPSQLVKTKDGWGLLMCQTPKFWTIWCQQTGCDLATDERFVDIPSRRANLPALSEAVDAVMMEKTTAEWTALLGGKVPFAPVLNIAEALDSPYVEQIGMTSRVDHPDTEGKGMRVLASPFRVNGARPAQTRAPKMGEHNDELLK